VLYNDPNVSFGGKITGGIRVRKPKNQAARSATEKAQALASQQQAKAAPSITDMEDDIPF
jgi:hypothetical protein